MSRHSKADRRAYEIKPQGDVTPLKAQILGFLAGDGCIAERRGRATNTDPCLLEWFIRAVQSVYDVTPCSTTQSKGRKRSLTDLFLCKAITLDLHSLSTWGIHQWRVPRCVLAGSDEVKAMYVRGFFDAEGSVFASVGIGSPGKHHNHVAATSANKAGLRDMGALLKSLGIGYGFYPFKIPVRGEVRTYYKIQVHKRSEVVRFANVIGFESPAKAATLSRVRLLPPAPRKGDVYERRLARIEELGLERSVAPVVARALDCSVKQVWDARKWARRNRPATA